MRFVPRLPRPRRVATLVAGVIALLLSATSVAQEAAEPRVATHYFYWYRWPTDHFDQPGAPGREGHRHHFPEPERVSWESPAWHAENFRDMAGCGIDFALPVYWGAPGAYDRPGLRFSRAGLGPMVEALEDLRERGEPQVRVGLFYDTSTLLCDVRGVEPRGGRADLTTADGKELFGRTVVEFFETLPARWWARLDGRALVVLYSSGFAAGWDETLGPSLRATFAARFPGEDVFLVADVSWGEIGQDRTTGWGAALHGPRLFPGVAQIGPGYDDSPVPGRRTPVRDRVDGAFYVWSWQQALASNPRLVLIETWNEMHEGTEICETLETSRQYLDLTRTWVDRLRRGGEPVAPIELKYPRPRSRPDHSWGAEAAGTTQVRVDYRSDPPSRSGLREVPHEDGPLRVDAGALCSAGARGDHPTYLYFQVSDHWRFDVEEDLWLVVTRRPGPRTGVQYDSRDSAATLHGAYTSASCQRRREESGWLVETWALSRARLANRQNAGADLRLVVHGADVTIGSVELRPVHDR